MSSLKLSSKIFYDDEDDDEEAAAAGEASNKTKKRLDMNDSMIEIGQIAILTSSKVSLRQRSSRELSGSKLINLKEDGSKLLEPPPTPIKSQTTEANTNLNQLKGFLFGVLSALGFCLSQVLMKRAKYLSPTDHSTVRYTITLITMILILRYKKLKILGPRKEFKLLAARGIFGAVSLILFYFAIMLLSPSDTVTLVHSGIIITAIISRIFLHEKLTIAHLIAILLTINGIVFISKPSFIFATRDDNKTVQLPKVNSTGTELDYERLKPILGITFALLSAFGTSCVFFTLKKLSNRKVHWASSVIYVCWAGIPISMLISVLLVQNGMHHQDFDSELKDLPMDLFYSCLASCMSLLGQIFLNIAFKYEESTKIAITKTVDVLFSCILQYLLLNITIDYFGVIGSCSILAGTFSILMFKLLENKYEKSLLMMGENNSSLNPSKKTSKRSLLLKFIFIKI